MPFLPALAAIAALAGTGISVGETLSNAGGPSQPKPTAPAALTPAQQSQTQLQQKSLISQQLPNIIGQTSGLVNPEYAAQIAQLLSGTAGQPGSTGAANSAIASAFGIPSGITGGGAGTPSKFTPAGAGGNTAAGAFPTSPVSLSDFVNSYISG